MTWEIGLRLMAAVGSLGFVASVVIYAMNKLLNGNVAWLMIGAAVLGAVSTGSKVSMEGGDWKVDVTELQRTIEQQQQQLAELKSEAENLKAAVSQSQIADVGQLYSVQKELSAKVDQLEDAYSKQGLALAKSDEQRTALVGYLQDWADAVKIGPDNVLVAKDAKEFTNALGGVKATDYKEFFVVDPKAPHGWYLDEFGKIPMKQQQ